MSQREKVLAILRDAGGFGATADHITQQTGCRRVAARVDELRKDGHKISGSFVDRAKGIYQYKLLSDAGSPEPPDDSPSELFPSNTPAPKCAIDDDWQAA